LNREELQAIAAIRFREAKALLTAGFPDGAFYLAGYSVECALKACIAKGTRRHDFPDKVRAQNSYTHNLKDLVKVAELDADLLQQATKPYFRDNWDVVQRWSEHSRYRRYDSDAAAALIEAIGNKKHGVMSWLKRHW
jgi:HEPN domain-containing protein